MPKILDDKRRYLCAVYKDNAPLIIRWLLRWEWFREKWARHCERLVSRMTEGDILRRYYEMTRRDSDEDYIISVSEKTL